MIFFMWAKLFFYILASTSTSSASDRHAAIHSCMQHNKPCSISTYTLYQGKGRKRRRRDKQSIKRCHKEPIWISLHFHVCLSKDTNVSSHVGDENATLAKMRVSTPFPFKPSIIAQLLTNLFILRFIKVNILENFVRLKLKENALANNILQAVLWFWRSSHGTVNENLMIISWKRKEKYRHTCQSIISSGRVCHWDKFTFSCTKVAENFVFLIIIIRFCVLAPL